MTLSIRTDALQRLFGMPLVVFVERGLERHLPPGLSDAALPFAGTVVGVRGDAVRTLDAGIPAVPMIVLERRGSVFGAELTTAAATAGSPFRPHIVRVPGRAPFGVAFGGSVQRVLLKIAVGLARRSAEVAGRREAEIAALRRQIADLQQTVGRRNDALAALGFSGEEFSLPFGALASVTGDDRGGRIVSSLEGVRSIQVRPTTPGIGQIAVEVTYDGAVLADHVMIPSDGARVLDLTVPADLLARDPLVEISVQQLRPGMDAVGNLAFDAVRFGLEGPTGVAANGPVIEPLAAAARDLRRTAFAASAAQRDTPLVLARGVVLAPADRVSIVGSPRGAPAGQPRLTFTRHGHTDRVEATTEHVEESGRVRLTGGVGAPGRYDVAVVANGPAIVWARPMLHRRAQDTPVAFASARFAALANAISFCDGPLEESAINAKNGFPAITVLDGDGYMQTHPVAGRILGARLPDLIPFGTTKLWIDVENAHHLAHETEFIAVVRHDIPSIPVANWLPPLPDCEGFSVTDVDDTTIVARTRLQPASSTAMRIDLLRPLPRGASLYCLVRPTGPETSYGWCRWHRIVVGIAPAASLSE